MHSSFLEPYIHEYANWKRFENHLNELWGFYHLLQTTPRELTSQEEQKLVRILLNKKTLTNENSYLQRYAAGATRIFKEIANYYGGYETLKFLEKNNLIKFVHLNLGVKLQKLQTQTPLRYWLRLLLFLASLDNEQLFKQTVETLENGCSGEKLEKCYEILLDTLHPLIQANKKGQIKIDPASLMSRWTEITKKHSENLIPICSLILQFKILFWQEEHFYEPNDFFKENVSKFLTLAHPETLLQSLENFKTSIENKKLSSKEIKSVWLIMRALPDKAFTCREFQDLFNNAHLIPYAQILEALQKVNHFASHPDNQTCNANEIKEFILKQPEICLEILNSQKAIHENEALNIIRINYAKLQISLHSVQLVKGLVILEKQNIIHLGIKNFLLEEHHADAVEFANVFIKYKTDVEQLIFLDQLKQRWALVAEKTPENLENMIAVLKLPKVSDFKGSFSFSPPIQQTDTPSVCLDPAILEEFTLEDISELTLSELELLKNVDSEIPSFHN